MNKTYPHRRAEEEACNTVETPYKLALDLFRVFKSYVPEGIILDPAVGNGRLLQPWKSLIHKTIGIDVRPIPDDVCDVQIHNDFLKVKELIVPDLILCNPPFNGSRDMMYPEKFLRHCVKLFGKHIPMVFIVPIGFRSNQSTHSRRRCWMLDHGPEITGIWSLPKDIFKNVQFFTEILIFNIPTTAHKWWPTEFL